MGLNLSALVTEQRNPNTMKIDEVSTEELCRLINAEDNTVPLAVEKELPQIARAIDVIAAQITVGLCLFPTSFCMINTGLTPPCSDPTTGLKSA